MFENKSFDLFWHFVSWENLYFIAPAVFFVSFSVGVVFYMICNQWSFSLSYYYAATVLLGEMFLVPSEASSYSQTFTLVYFLWGSTLMAGIFILSYYHCVYNLIVFISSPPPSMY
jgi:hypothetical protein